MKVLASRGVRILMTGLLLGSSGCAYGFGGTGESDRGHRPGHAVLLHVTNNSGRPMEIYAAGSGTVYRIGTVHPGLAGNFVVRPAMIGNGSVELVARSLGGAVVRSGPMLVAPGDIVDLELEPHVATSNATVRARLPR